MKLGFEILEMHMESQQVSGRAGIRGYPSPSWPVRTAPPGGTATPDGETSVTPFYPCLLRGFFLAIKLPGFSWHMAGWNKDYIPQLLVAKSCLCD